jgi:hypothetical protein
MDHLPRATVANDPARPTTVTPSPSPLQYQNLEFAAELRRADDKLMIAHIRADRADDKLMIAHIRADRADDKLMLHTSERTDRHAIRERTLALAMS